MSIKPPWIKDKTVPVTFTFSHNLQASNPFVSDWVSNVYYAERARELVLVTKAGDHYLYDNVPRMEYNMLVDTAKAGGSVGNAVNNIKHRFGPSRNQGPFTFIALEAFNVTVQPTDVVSVPKSSVADRTLAVSDALAAAEALPECYGVEVVYLLGGSEQRMKTQTNPEQALRDYTAAVKTMGLKAELLRVEILYKKPDLPF